jgi:hypothetical protein
MADFALEEEAVDRCAASDDLDSGDQRAGGLVR